MNEPLTCIRRWESLLVSLFGKPESDEGLLKKRRKNFSSLFSDRALKNREKYMRGLINEFNLEVIKEPVKHPHIIDLVNFRSLGLAEKIRTKITGDGHPIFCRVYPTNNRLIGITGCLEVFNDISDQLNFGNMVELLANQYTVIMPYTPNTWPNNFRKIYFYFVDPVSRDNFANAFKNKFARLDLPYEISAYKVDHKIPTNNTNVNSYLPNPFLVRYEEKQ